MHLDLQAALHPLVHSIDVAWVPPTAAVSSTFDLVFAQAPRLLAVHSAGFHVRVTAVSTSIAAFANESNHDAIEDSVRRVLQEIFPSAGVLPSFQRGFLAKSLCHFRSWRSADPLQEALDPSAPSLCLSSAFSFPESASDAAVETRKSRLPAFASAQSDGENLGATTSAELVSAVEHYFRGNVADLNVDARLIQVAVAHESDSTRLSVDILEAWTADGGDDGLLSWRSRPSSEEGASARLLVVSSIREGVVNYAVYPDDDGESVSAATHTLPRYALKLSPPTSVTMSIDGEGFHRRVVLDVDATNILSSDCEPAASRVLMRIPLSHEVYADLDELRNGALWGAPTACVRKAHRDRAAGSSLLAALDRARVSSRGVSAGALSSWADGATERQSQPN
ncbi:hypothetical protein PybrP1_008829 [[Pythium] brassicae (nom. inval.)]|nr:hypothetical protein PybrP1_008829 [[Pythium] brassicae (nom. inval.)]